MLLTKDEFLNQKHLLGYGKIHPKVNEFLGDYVAISVSNSILNIENYLTEKKKLKKSTHCGLTKEEMEVPLIVIG